MAVIIVSTVTAFNDFQKDKQFRALNKESSRLKIKVVRNGESNNVEIDYLLCGVSDRYTIIDMRQDLVILGTGDQVPADGILVEGHDLRIDESVMTGELKPVKKNEEVPFLMSGCQVAEGYGKMLITAVGM
jgi:Ca2+-transporting ATPase